MKLVIPVSVIAALILTMIYSLATAAVSGHNTATGEAINLSGWQAIYVYVAQKGLDSYLIMLLPVFITFTAVIAITGRYLLKKRQKTAQ